MFPHGRGEIAIAGIDEETYARIDGGPFLQRVTATNTYTGAIEGEGKQTLLLLFLDGEAGPWGAGRWVGIEQITGQIDGRSGSFVIEQRGTFDNTNAAKLGWEGGWQVVDGSGTGDLRGLRGGGRVSFNEDIDARAYTFDYDIV